MKTCSKCKKSKPLSEYSLVHPAKQDGKVRPDCKECVRARSRRAYQQDPVSHAERMVKLRAKSAKQARNFIDSYLSEHPCIDCGEADPVVLEFDHVRGNKFCDVSRMVHRNYRLWRIKKEVEKCEVRCANCHRRVTAKRRIFRSSTHGERAPLLTENKSGSIPLAGAKHASTPDGGARLSIV